MVLFPNAKINLGLRVLSKRSDGFHNIETLFVPIAWRDVVEVVASPHFALCCTGIAVDADTEQNLCTRAFRMLQRDYALPNVAIYLHKQIPTGAGLGGGSSDAAFVLRALNELFAMQLSDETLLRYAAMLGSDCAFFTVNRPMLATGRGEVLTSANVALAGYELMVVKPPFGVSTAEAYANVKPQTQAESLLSVVAHDISEWKKRLHNDFEPSVFARYPQLADIKQHLYRMGARYAAMSGSGSAVYGIFDAIPDDAERAFAGCSTFRQQL